MTDDAPLVTVSKASTPVDAPQHEQPPELLFTADDAPADKHQHKFPFHVLTKCAMPSVGGPETCY